MPSGRPDIARIVRTNGFRAALGLFVFGFLLLLLSQAITHDYGFLELGGLFTLSIYDLVLAMLGLAVAFAMANTVWAGRAIVLSFLGVLLVMLYFFDAILNRIMTTLLGENLFLIAPTAVIVTGISLWLPGRFRRIGVPIAAGLVGFSFALFIGLDDLGIGIGDFTQGAVLTALWLILSPGLLLRQFRGDWLKIPSRIVGSWLSVIGVIVMVSLYVPVKDKAPPPPGTAPAAGDGMGLPDGTTMTLPDGTPIEMPGSSDDGTEQ
ncbi:MAG: hypothetical protein ACOH2J_04060 [Allorhizobium sp.]